MPDSSCCDDPSELETASTFVDRLKNSGYQVVRPLDGGEFSEVFEVVTPDGVHAVAKTCADLSSLEVEARWLGRCPVAPEVVLFDAAAGLLVLEYIDGTLLRAVAADTAVDWVREAEFVKAVSSVGMGDSRALVPDVVDVIGSIFMLFADRHAELDVPAVTEWFDWARSRRPFFGVVAFDVMTKNTLVTPDAWWAIDPWCVRGPAVLPEVRWAVDRARHAPQGRTFDVLMNQFTASLDADTSEVVAWVPAALLWTWCARVNHGQSTSELASEVGVALDAWRHIVR